MPRTQVYHEQLDAMRGELAELHDDRLSLQQERAQAAPDSDDSEDVEAIRKYMMSRPEFCQTHGERAYQEAAKIVRHGRAVPPARFEPIDIDERAPAVAAPLAPLPDFPDDDTDHTKIHRYMMAHPEFVQRHGSAAYQQVREQMVGSAEPTKPVRGRYGVDLADPKVGAKIHRYMREHLYRLSLRGNAFHAAAAELGYI